MDVLLFTGIMFILLAIVAIQCTIAVCDVLHDILDAAQWIVERINTIEGIIADMNGNGACYVPDATYADEQP